MSGQVSLIDGHIDNAERCVCCGRVIPEGSQYCVICGQKPKQKQRQIDRIRNMSVEEMAEFILMMAIGYCSGQVPKNIKEWLESEVDTE